MERDPLLNDVSSDEEAAVVKMVLRRRAESEQPKRRLRTQRMPSRATKAGRRQRARMAAAYLARRQ